MTKSAASAIGSQLNARWAWMVIPSPGISFLFLVGRKLQCQTQQRDCVQLATSELPGCPSAWTTGQMDRGRMTRRMTGRPDSGEASFLIPTSFTICNNNYTLLYEGPNDWTPVPNHGITVHAQSAYREQQVVMAVVEAAMRAILAAVEASATGNFSAFSMCIVI